MDVSVFEATVRLADLIAEVERTGEEVVIHRHDVPVAKLVPFRPTLPPRRLGGWGDAMIADDFDDLPAELASAFGT